jgi:hypothetical protein
MMAGKNVGATPYINVDGGELFSQATAISPAEADSIKKRQEAIDKLLSEKGLAKYKLELLFTGARSVHKPFPGIVTWWESGSKFHGGGDSKLYQCPGKHLGGDCESFIPDSANGLNYIVCPACGRMWKNEQVIGEVYYNMPMQKWADVVTTWFQKLQMNADIRIKYARDDIREAARLEQDRQLHGDILEQVRSEDRRSVSVYPLANIIKDTSNGADLRERILAYLRA